MATHSAVERPAATPLSIPAIARRYARTLWYRSYAGEILRRLGLGNQKVRHDAAYWDRALAGPLAPYLGGTVTIAMRDSLVAALMSHFLPAAATVLDVGCAAGSLSRALARTPVTRYVGIDISQYAVTEAQRQQAADPQQFVPRSEFCAADLCAFALPPGVRPDALVFNEVLYYFSPEIALAQVIRYLQTSAPAACAFVSMKHDPKSQVILDLLSRHLRRIDGVLFQEKPGDCRYRVSHNVERPAYMLAIFQLPPALSPDPEA